MTVRVEQINWTRTYFELDYQATEGEELFLFHIEGGFVSFSTETHGDKVHASINLVTAFGRKPLSDGYWVICQKIPEDLLQDENRLRLERPYIFKDAGQRISAFYPQIKQKTKKSLENETSNNCLETIRKAPYDTHGITYTDDIFARIDTLERVFIYNQEEHAYTARLIPKTDASDYPYLVLDVGFYEKNHKPWVRKHNIRFREKQILSGLSSFVSRMVRHHGNRVLFFKQNGSEATPNMAAVRDRMIERGLDKEFEIHERYRDTFARVAQSPKQWLSDLFAIARSDYIFIDDYCPAFNFIKPARHAVLTQIWHAGVGFKSVGYARFGIDGSPDPYHSSHRMYTYALVGNKYLRDIYSEVFGIEKSALLATGMPRLDHFLDKDTAEKARKDLQARYPWMKQGRVVVFAPTYRGTGQRDAYYPYDVFFDSDRLYEVCEKTNTYFVFEMHGFIQEHPQIPENYADRIFDLSDESLDELYHVSDVLVTDYSSCFYDYLLLEKPVVFYVPDKVIYSATRGIQRTVDEMAPGVICDTFEDFMNTLETSNYQAVEPDPSCIDRCIEGDMLASDRVIDVVLLGRDVPGVKLEDD